MMELDWMTEHEDDIFKTPYYLLSQALEKYRVIPLADGNGALVINLNEHTNLLKFAVFYKGSENNGDTELELVFQGMGYADEREIRHTWWGDDEGYLHFLSGKVVSAALRELSNYFDDMV